MAECFICMETENQLYKVCRCNTLVHAACLARLINDTPSHSTRCPVCMQDYDISITEIRRWVPITGTSNLVCISLVVFTIILGMSVGIIIFIESYKQNIVLEQNMIFFSILKGTALGVASTASLFIVIVIITHYRSTGNVCCYKPINIITNREINLTNSRHIQIQLPYIEEI